MREWISVKDRLPSDQRDVLTVNGHGKIRTMGLLCKWADRWKWVYEHKIVHINDITYWMPLPEPPKGRNANER